MAFVNDFHTYTKNPSEVTPGIQLILPSGDFSVYERGALAGEAISSQIVNTGIKTGSLIGKCLIDALTKSQTIPSLNVYSDEEDVIDFIKQGIKETKVDNAEQADYASSDHSKGTIEERLTKLGFKEANVSLVTGNIYQGSIRLRRQGNYVTVITTAKILCGRTGGEYFIHYTDEQFFKPKDAGEYYPFWSSETGIGSMKILSDGSIRIYFGNYEGTQSINIRSGGYEAIPL